MKRNMCANLDRVHRIFVLVSLRGGSSFKGWGQTGSYLMRKIKRMRKSGVKGAIKWFGKAEGLQRCGYEQCLISCKVVLTISGIVL